MERLVALVCWLFNSEQHLEGQVSRLEERHEAVGVRNEVR